jgi:hypothetical protein
MRDGPPERPMGDPLPIWPRTWSTAIALLCLLAVQVALFLAATERSFFAHEDLYNFALAQERSFLHYLATPIIHTYPAPGNRLLFFVVYQLFSLNYLAARLLLLALLAATTILLGHLVRTLARCDEWWTVALLTPFALSLSLVSPVNLWSNGVPVFPTLLFTVVALSAWIRSYGESNRAFWIGVTVIAIAATTGFYLKFLLIPVYLLFFRLAILPRLLDLPPGIRALWQERNRWLAVAAPGVLYVAVYILSGLAARSYVPGDRPFLAYLETAWFRVVIPIAMLNVPLDSTPSTASWVIVVCSQVLFWGVVWATWRRSSLAFHGWALFTLAFLLNMIMVGAVRLAGHGVTLAYWLRYYPEVVLIFPMALALGLRQGAERRPELAWERTLTGRTVIGVFACVQAVSLAIWAPRIVSKSDGARSRVWFDNLRSGLDAAQVDQAPLRIVDSNTPEYVVLSWMAPYNRVSTILRLLGVAAIYNDASGPMYDVLPDGRLAVAAFRPMLQLLPAAPGDAVHLAWHRSPGSVETCLQDVSLQRAAGAELVGDRLALRVFYSAKSRGAVALRVQTSDPERPYRDFQLFPVDRRAELVDLGASRIRALTVEALQGDRVCIERMEIGSLAGRRNPL